MKPRLLKRKCLLFKALTSPLLMMFGKSRFHLPEIYKKQTLIYEK